MPFIAIVLGWPAVIASIVITLYGFASGRWRLVMTGACLAVPFLAYPRSRRGSGSRRRSPASRTSPPSGRSREDDGQSASCWWRPISRWPRWSRRSFSASSAVWNLDIDRGTDRSNAPPMNTETSVILLRQTVA
jgi:hypothetical protein